MMKVLEGYNHKFQDLGNHLLKNILKTDLRDYLLRESF